MASIAAIQPLRLSDGRGIEAHVLAVSGHILLIPLCALVKCNGKDPWRRGRKTLKSVVKKLLRDNNVADGVDKNDLDSLAPPYNARAMHHSVVGPFIKQYYYDVSAHASDVQALADVVASKLASSAARAAELGLSDTTDAEPGVVPGAAPTTTDDNTEGASDGTLTTPIASEVTLANNLAGDDPANVASSSGASRQPDAARVHGPMIIFFEGSRWVDAIAEWDAIPEVLQNRKAMWHTRLAGVGINIAACRVSKLGDIRKLAEAHTGGSKSVYVPLCLWTTVLQRVSAGSAATRAVSNLDAWIHRKLTDPLPLLHLAPEEVFRYAGTCCSIATYGERSLDGFYASYDDFTRELGVRQATPEVELFTARLVNGGSTTVINFRDMLRLVAMSAHKSSVASAMMDWVTDLVFRSKFGYRDGEADTTRDRDVNVAETEVEDSTILAYDWHQHAPPSQTAHADLEERASRLLQDRALILQECDRAIQERDRTIQECDRALKDLEREKRRTTRVRVALRECLNNQEIAAQTMLQRIACALVCDDA